MRKAAIETASVDMLKVFESVSDESMREKRAVPPINRMIYYWTRKPLIVGRAVALACTLEKPEEVKELLGLNEKKQAYKQVPDRVRYKEMLGSDPSDISVLDPFAGTGNLAFSSAEMGLDVTCSDYNPLAYLISRGSLEIPSRFDSGLAKEFENAANNIIQEVENEVGQFYTARKLAYIWAWCIRCTHCNQRIPLLNQMYLSKHKKIGLRFIPTQDKDFVVEIVENISEKNGKSFTQKRGKVQCISCGNTIGYKAMTQDIAKNKDKEMIAIQIQKPGRQGRGYVLPSADDKKQYKESSQYLKNRYNEMIGLVPQENILASHQNTLWFYGIRRWNEFFNDRQLLILATLM